MGATFRNTGLDCTVFDYVKGSGPWGAHSPSWLLLELQVMVDARVMLPKETAFKDGRTSRSSSVGPGHGAIFRYPEGVGIRAWGQARPRGCEQEF